MLRRSIQKYQFVAIVVAVKYMNANDNNKYSLGREHNLPMEENSFDDEETRI